MATAGNVDADLGAYPQGGKSIVIIQSKIVAIAASKTNYVWDVMRIPFSFVPLKVEIISQAVVLNNAITIDVADDESTPQVMVNDEALAAITDGAATASSIVSATIDDAGPFLAQGALIFRYTSGATDSSIATAVRIWARPVKGKSE